MAAGTGPASHPLQVTALLTQAMHHLLKNHSLVLMEAAVVERLRRSGQIRLHDRLVHAPLIYDPVGRDLLGGIYREYIRLARLAGHPMLLCTPTWRTNQARVRASSVRHSINVDATHFLRALIHPEQNGHGRIKLGGMIGCKHDCYQPGEGLSTAEARQFHAWQIDQLVQGGVDFLIAQTLPHVGEALGIAQAMQTTGLPYIISFVISREGVVLDGTPLRDAQCIIDSNTIRSPLGYMVNCAHPSFLCPAQQSPELFTRLIGYLANASSRDHDELDNAEMLEVDRISEWGDLMLDLNRTYGMRVLGGCCGTGSAHLQYLVDHRRDM